MHEVRRIRLRDGAMQWGLFADSAVPTATPRSSWSSSWLEHLRQHERVTHVDTTSRRRRAFHVGDEPPVVQHLIASPPRRTR